MALRIKLPPATRPPIRFEPIIKPEIPAELLRRGSTPPMPRVTPGPTPASTPVSMPTPKLMSVPSPMAGSLPQMAPVAAGQVAAPALPLTARTLFAERTSAAPFPASVAALNPLPVAALPATAPSEAAAEGTELEEPPASEALLKHSSAPALIRASSLIFKWGVIAAILMGIGFLALKFLVPFLDELRNPGRTDAIANKEAPTAVRVLQQTRQVVAKNDAKVAYLDTVVAAMDGNAVAPKAAPAKATPEAAAAPAVEAKAPAVRVASDLSAFQEAVSRLTVGGVFDGPEPRAYLDGRLVKYGEIINRNLGLRFVGVDPDQHAVLFTNADNVTFRKHF